VGQWNHGIEEEEEEEGGGGGGGGGGEPFGLASYGKKCIQIEDQLSTVFTAMNKTRRRSTTSIPSYYPIRKEHEPHDDVVGTTSISSSSRGPS
jgi:hypothetical protein